MGSATQARSVGLAKGVSRTVLLAAQPFGRGLPAPAVLDALGAGLQESGLPAPFLLQLEGKDAEALDAKRLDGEMKASRAVVIAAPRLDERTLLASAPFEIATRARQAGVPCYAVTARDDLARFDARILDLQAVLQAGTKDALIEAGRALGAIV